MGGGVSFIDGHIDEPKENIKNNTKEKFKMENKKAIIRAEKGERTTAQKALTLLNDMEFAEKYQGKDEYTDMLLMCKSALEKQIPKKPFMFKCPNCQSDNVCVRQDGGFSETKFDYCPDCGQALDWGDSE